MDGTPQAPRPPADEPPAQPRSRPSRTTVIVVAVGALLLLALVLVVTQRGTAQFPPDSPEATVQTFLQSVADGEPDTTVLAGDCDDGRLDIGDAGLRVVITDAAVSGDTATIDVRITERYGGPFGDGYNHDETYRLVRTADGWLIEQFDWPWGACEPLQPGG